MAPADATCRLGHQPTHESSSRRVPTRTLIATIGKAMTPPFFRPSSHVRRSRAGAREGCAALSRRLQAEEQCRHRFAVTPRRAERVAARRGRARSAVATAGTLIMATTVRCVNGRPGPVWSTLGAGLMASGMARSHRGDGRSPGSDGSPATRDARRPRHVCSTLRRRRGSPLGACNRYSGLRRRTHGLPPQSGTVTADTPPSASPRSAVPAGTTSAPGRRARPAVCPKPSACRSSRLARAGARRQRARPRGRGLGRRTRRVEGAGSSARRRCYRPPAAGSRLT